MRGNLKPRNLTAFHLLSMSNIHVRLVSAQPQAVPLAIKNIDPRVQPLSGLSKRRVDLERHNSQNAL